MSIRRHPRSQIVAKARIEIGMAIADLGTRHDLTYAEIFSILGGEIQSYAKYAIRDERHPDDKDKGGDEA